MPPPNEGMLFTPPLKDGKGVKAGVKEAARTLAMNLSSAMADTVRSFLSPKEVMSIGYNHAVRLIDLLEERGGIGPQVGAQPREILRP